jgi:O-antigen/teichoic acid export membrane protein
LNRLGRNSLNLATGNAAVNLIGLVQTILIAKFMGASIVGLLGIISSYAIILNSISGFRTSDCLTKFIVEYKLDSKPKEMRHIIALSLSLDVTTRILAVICFVGGAFFLEKLMINDPRSFWAFAFTVVLSLSTSLDSVWFSLMRDENRYTEISSVNAILAIIKTSLIALLALWGALNIKSLAIVMVLSGLLRLIAVGIGVRRIMYARFGSSPGFSEYLAALRNYDKDAGFWTNMRAGWFSTLVSTIVKNGDTLLLGGAVSIAEVGVYKTARTIVSAIQSIFSNFQQAAYQEINMLVCERKFRELRTMLARTTTAILIAGLAVWVAAWITAPAVLSFLYGSDFIGAAKILNILLLGLALSFCLYWVPVLGISLGFGPSIYRNTSLVGLVSIFLMAMAAKYFGSIGVSFALAGAWAFSAGILLITVPILNVMRAHLVIK